MDYSKLGNRIRQRRLELGFSQEKLAELSNVSTAYIGQIERFNRTLSVETLISISNALGVTVDYLLNDYIFANSDYFINQVVNMFASQSDKSKQIAIDLLKTLFLHME